MYENCNDDASQTGVKLNFAEVKNLVELKEKYAKFGYKTSSNSVDLWQTIADELNYDEVTANVCQIQYQNLYGQFCTMRDQNNSDLENWEFFPIFAKHYPKSAKFKEKIDFIVNNFQRICRFCLKQSSYLRLIFDDQTEESINESNVLIDKINAILFESGQTVDCKLSNLCCESCLRSFNEFFKFKQMCMDSSELLTEAQNQIQSNITLDTEETFEEQQHKKESEESERETTEQEDPVIESEVRMNNEDSIRNGKEHKNKSKKKSDYKRKSHQCQVCGKLVVCLKSHLYVHSGERKYCCKFCGKKFMQPGNLGIHIQSHLNIRKYKCDLCDKDFVHRYSLKKHMVVHNKDDLRFPCSLCEKKFTRQRVLALHEKTHRQERNYVCDICNKDFVLRQTLKKHYRTHTGEKPYSCSYCDKKFSTSYNRKVHLRVHTNEKPFKCSNSNCDLVFSHKSSLRTHQERIHNVMSIKNEIT